MKIRILLLITFIVLFQILWSQKATNNTLLEEIRQESFDLAVLDEEVDYYQQLVDKRNRVKSLLEQNRLSTIREIKYQI